MKSYYLFLMLNISIAPFYILTGQSMAYYTDLSETIDGEKHLSIYTFANTYLLKGRLRGMSVSEIESLLNNIGVKSVYSSVKIEKGEMLMGEDENPSEIYPLSVLMNINDGLIIANVDIETQNETLKLNTKGEVFLNEVYVANITKDYEIIDLEKNVLARLESQDILSLMDGEAQLTLKNNERKTLTQIEKNGSFKVGRKSFEWNVFGGLLINGNKLEVKGNSLPRELRQTASVLYFVFFEKKMISIEEIVKNEIETKLKQKINQNYNTKLRSKSWEDKGVKETDYNFNLLLEQVINNETKEVYTKKTITKKTIEDSSKLYDSISIIKISIPGNYKKRLPKFEYKNLKLRVFQVKNINIIINKGELKSSLGNEDVNRAVVNKIQLDGMYNISFNYAFLNEKQIVNTIYYTKTSILKPKKSISDKILKLDLDSKGDPGLAPY